MAAPDLVRTFTGWTSLLAALDAAIQHDVTRSEKASQTT
jgi:hypothetical protein